MHKVGFQYCRQLRKKQGQLGDIWYLDEVFINLSGALPCTLREVEQAVHACSKTQ